MTTMDAATIGTVVGTTTTTTTPILHSKEVITKADNNDAPVLLVKVEGQKQEEEEVIRLDATKNSWNVEEQQLLPEIINDHDSNNSSSHIEKCWDLPQSNSYDTRSILEHPPSPAISTKEDTNKDNCGYKNGEMSSYAKQIWDKHHPNDNDESSNVPSSLDKMEEEQTIGASIQPNNTNHETNHSQRMLPTTVSNDTQNSTVQQECQSLSFNGTTQENNPFPVSDKGKETMEDLFTATNDFAVFPELSKESLLGHDVAALREDEIRLLPTTMDLTDDTSLSQNQKDRIQMYNSKINDDSEDDSSHIESSSDEEHETNDPLVNQDYGVLQDDKEPIISLDAFALLNDKDDSHEEQRERINIVDDNDEMIMSRLTLDHAVDFPSIDPSSQQEETSIRLPTTSTMDGTNEFVEFHPWDVNGVREETTKQDAFPHVEEESNAKLDGDLVTTTPESMTSNHKKIPTIPLLKPPSTEKMNKWLKQKKLNCGNLNTTKLSEGETSANFDANFEEPILVKPTVDQPVKDHASLETCLPPRPKVQKGRSSTKVQEETSDIADDQIKNDSLLSEVNDELNRLEQIDDAEGTPNSSFQEISSLYLLTPNRSNIDTTRHNSSETKQSLPESNIKSLDEKYFIIPTTSPSPFEIAVWNIPKLVVYIATFLGNPESVCRLKMINKFCHRIVVENEHNMMKQAVRLGGISAHLRPSFWMWITLDCWKETPRMEESSMSKNKTKFVEFELKGRESKWSHVIQKDVSRAFGNMPPHKTGARLRNNSVISALAASSQHQTTKGNSDKNRLNFSGQSSMRPKPVIEDDDESEDDIASSISPTNTVSDWGGVSPVGSFVTETDGSDSDANKRTGNNNGVVDECVLNLTGLTNEIKIDLQNKLGFILHAIAGAHEKLGYCQGMDYVVAHLIRILQDTIHWKRSRGTLIVSKSSSRESNDKGYFKSTIDPSDILVEEVVFRVMNRFLTTYNLRHMYWPELRILKTSCRVFEKLIEQKLPVLADHFHHHELRVGLFALGWFQTLFLYLPSMPSATVCHLWDIWLVERSLKIFFRVGTAILFLSQPILLNNDLEGMMIYLNTFPDSTLLRPDILIPCALRIKVTNRMLLEIEKLVIWENEVAHGLRKSNHII